MSEAPSGAGEQDAGSEPVLTLYPLSAGSPEPLSAHAGAVADHLSQNADVTLSSVGHTLAHRRSQLAHRAAIVAANRDELRRRLRALADGAAEPTIVTGQPLREPHAGPVWVFSGHGSHWRGMGVELLKSEPAFARVIDTLTPIFQAEVGFSPRQVIIDGELDGVDRIQMMIFAVQVGLAEVWRGYGVTPSAVIGHSVGEIAAAVASGALELAAAARLICRRSTLLRRVAGNGAMAMVALPFDEVQQQLAGRDDLVAAISASPSSTVVSGDPGAVGEFSADCRQRGVPVREVDSDVAFHSPHMDALTDELARAVGDLTPRRPVIPMYLTATENPRAPLPLSGSYWAANLRNPVLLTSAVAAAVADGHRAFIEVSPHPVVTHSILECLGDREDVFVGSSLRRERPERETMLAAVAAAHCHGVAVDWSRLQPGGALATLPTTPWHRQTYWREPQPPVAPAARGHDVRRHDLLGSPTVLAGSDVRAWHTSLDDASRPYPGSHAINGTEIVPAAVYLCTFLAALPDSGGVTELADISMTAPLMTAERRDVQVVAEGSELRLASRPAREDVAWQLHATAEAGAGDENADWGTLALDDVGWEQVDPDFIRQRLATVGVPDTGFVWSVEKLSSSPRKLRATVLASEPDPTWATALDAIMSVAPCAYPGDPQLRVIVGVDRIQLRGRPPADFVIDCELDDTREDTVHVTLSEAGGRIIAVLTSLRYAVIGAAFAEQEATAVGEAGSRGSHWAAVPATELWERVRDEVCAQIAGEMKLPVASLQQRRPLVEQGLDSVMTVVIRKRLAREFDCELSPTLFWQLPTVSAIADHLTEVIQTRTETDNASLADGGSDGTAS